VITKAIAQEFLDKIESENSRRRLTAEQRRLAEDNFANSHPFLILFVWLFSAIYVLSVCIADRLVTRAKTDI